MLKGRIGGTIGVRSSCDWGTNRWLRLGMAF